MPSAPDASPGGPLGSFREEAGPHDTRTAVALVRDKSWFHDFEIVPGVRTHGDYDPSGLWRRLKLPEDLSGLFLADVGASNGYFSFEARKRGARVVAFDHRHRDNSGFAVAQHINGLDGIEHHQVNALDLSPERHGRFDIVLVLGLLYHVSSPLVALARCATLSLQRLLVESYCIDSTLPRKLRAQPLMRFIPDCERFPERGHLNRDRSNFWGLTSTCIQRMIEDVGFAVDRVELSADRVLIDAHRVVEEDETRSELAVGVRPAIVRRGDPDDPEAWVIF
jgi:tRNA (mo5U34)-methyltransferase